MSRLREVLGHSGILQLELFPFHSPKLPKDDRILSRLQEKDPLLKRYSNALTEFLATSKIVWAISAAAAPMNKTPAVKVFAKQMRLDLATARFLCLKEKNGKPTLGLFYQNTGGRTRAISCMTGHNGLPGKDSFACIRDALLS